MLLELISHELTSSRAHSRFQSLGMFGGADVGAFSQDDFDVYQWINKVCLCIFVAACICSSIPCLTLFSCV